MRLVTAALVSCSLLGSPAGADPASAYAGLLDALGLPPRVFDTLAIEGAHPSRAIDTEAREADLARIDDAYAEYFAIPLTDEDVLALSTTLSEAASQAGVSDAAYDPAALRTAIDQEFGTLDLSPERLDDVLCHYAAALWAVVHGAGELLSDAADIRPLCQQLDLAEFRMATVGREWRDRFPALRNLLLARIVVLRQAVEAAADPADREALSDIVRARDGMVLDGLRLTPNGFVATE